MSRQVCVCLLTVSAFLSTIFCAYIVFFKKTENKGRFFAGRKTILVSGLLLFAFWFFSLAIALLNSTMEYITIKDLWPKRIPQILGCIVSALNFFSIDESFNDFVTEIGNIAEKYFSMSDSGIYGFRIYASLLYLSAPIAGGALIFDLITSLFPKLKLSVSYFRVWREIIYFSELNEESYVMADSMMKKSSKKGLKPIIVFTDVYVDNEYEKSMELVLSAKSIGAICVSDDLLHIHIRPFRKKLFLADRAEENNIHTLVSLTSDKKASFLKNAEIYYFTLGNVFADVGDKVKADFLNEENAPVIIAVNPYRNLSRNLLFDLPLYAPLVGRENDEKTLNVTIMGAGNIGTEMFLSSYWYGQIYGYELCINMISKESEKEFIDKINFINPDIFDSCVRVKAKKFTEGVDEAFAVGEGTTARFKDIMKKYTQSDELSKPYFKFRYYQTNITDDDLEVKVSEKLWEDNFKIVDSDYFFISIGNDSDNLAVSDKLRTFVSLYHKEEKMKNSIISYVLYDTELTEFMNKENRKSQNDVYMHAIGGLSDVFDIENVCMMKNESQIKAVGNVYDKLTKRVTKDNYKSQQYEYWANIARAFHLSYKVFSAGFIKNSVFADGEVQNDGYNDYIDAIRSDKDLQKRLAWLEHRRWNAFMRVNGFRCPKDFTVYCNETNTHKNLDLKLHPCIVECDEERMDFFNVEEQADLSGFDMLDMVAYNAYHKFYKNINPDDKRNFKQYDFPIYDFPLSDGEIDENFIRG